MTMKLVKKTAEYSIFKRGDERYAVKDANKKAVNGEEKVRILLAEELVKPNLVAKPVVAEVVEEAPAAPAEEVRSSSAICRVSRRGTKRVDSFSHSLLAKVVYTFSCSDVTYQLINIINSRHLKGLCNINIIN